jgi:O-antigen/teichoic acid export membrane protein
MTRNAVLRAVTEVLVKLGSFVLFAALARAVGQSEFGTYTFALAITQVLYAFCGFGLDRMVVRDIARDRSALHHVLWDALSLKLAALLSGLAVSSAILAMLGHQEHLLGLVAILGAGVAATFAATSAYSVFQAFERMQFFVYVAVPSGALNVVLGLTFLGLGWGTAGVALGALLSSAFSAVLAFWLVARAFDWPAVGVRPRHWPALLKDAAPFGLQEMLGQIVFRFDTLLLGLLATSVAVGAYGAAYRLLEASLFIAWSIGSSVLPQLSYLPGRDEPQTGEHGTTLGQAYASALKLVLTVTAPIGVALFVCADAVIDFVYGDEFADAAGLLRILSVALVVYGVGHLTGILVLVRRPPRTSILFNGGVALLNVVICLVLIPLHDAHGAAWATLISEGALAIGGLVLGAAVAGVPRARDWLLTPLLGSAAMAAAMLPLSGSLVLAGVAGGAAYAAVVALVDGRRLLT